MKTVVAEIRRAVPGDAEALAGVHDGAWRNAYSGLIPHQSLNAMIARRGPAWWVGAIRRDASILVLEFGGEAVGYSTFGRNRAQALAAGGEIYEIYLKPEYQGLGFGRRLFQAARVALRTSGMRGLAVWALAENIGARGFYTAAGGVDVAEGEERFGDRTVRKIAFLWR